jgi:hypothetical protein
MLHIEIMKFCQNHWSLLYIYICVRYTVHYTYSHREGGEQTREKVREAIVHKAGQKYQHDCL